jgi:hypothetical protein
MLRVAHRRLVLAGILFLVTIGTALAQTEKVYVTRTGTKYHRESCSSLRSSKIEMPLAEAAARYGPCANCRPPVPGAATPQQPAAAGQPEVAPAVERPATPAAAAPAPRSTRCQAITKKGTQCSRTAQAGSSYCWQHAR